MMRRFFMLLLTLLLAAGYVDAKDMVKEADKLLKSVHKQWEKQDSYTAEINYNRTAGISERVGEGRLIRKVGQLRVEIDTPYKFIHDFSAGSVLTFENEKETVRDMTPLDDMSKEFFYGIGDITTLTRWYNTKLLSSDKDRAEIEMTVKEGSSSAIFPRGILVIDTKRKLVTEIAFFRGSAVPLYVATTTYVEGLKHAWYPELATFTMYYGKDNPALAYEVRFKNQTPL